jgi:putative membrane protein (TIGR04086 family)
MGRSIGAVTVGLLYTLAGICLTQVILWFCFPEEEPEYGGFIVPPPPAYFTFTIICTALSAVLGGFMAAHLARRAELTHGLALGLTLAALLAVTALVSQRESPAWYRLMLPLAAMPAALLGAFFRARVRGLPPPAPPGPS